MNRYLKRQDLFEVQDNQTTCLTSNANVHRKGMSPARPQKLIAPVQILKRQKIAALDMVWSMRPGWREVFTLSTEAEISQASRYWVPDAHSEDVVEHTIPLNNSKQIVDAAMQTMDCEYHCIGTQTSSELLCAQTQTNEISLEINAASSLLQCHPQFGFKCNGK